jgi:hypothetical protein
MLTPISEDRRVTFAAQYVVADAGNNTVYVPYDVVGVRFIPHLSEYKRSHKQDIWYTSEEIREMKQAAFRDIDLRREEMMYNTARGKDFTCDIRGLERLVYGDNEDCLQRRYESLCAILKEQHNQQQQHEEKHPEENTFDEEERIRQVCMAKGNTIKSQARAQQLAMEDEAEVKHYLEEEEETARIPSTPEPQPQCPYQEAVLSPMMGRHPQHRRTTNHRKKDNCCWCVDVVDVVGRSLLSHVLLKPFIDMRQPGDIFLDHPTAA